MEERVWREKQNTARAKSSDVAARERRETGGDRLDYMLLLCLSLISFNINIFLIIAFNCYSVQLTGYWLSIADET